MRFAIDVDLTLCELKKGKETYLDVKPLPGAIEALNKLRNQGHYIIIYSARGMRTFNANLGKVNAERLPEMIAWLAKHSIPYDEILLGKPDVDYFIDDKNIEFNSWEQVMEKLNI